MTDNIKDMPDDVSAAANRYIWQDGDGNRTAVGYKTRKLLQDAFFAGYKHHDDKYQAVVKERDDLEIAFDSTVKAHIKASNECDEADRLLKICLVEVEKSFGFSFSIYDDGEPELKKLIDSIKQHLSKKECQS